MTAARILITLLILALPATVAAQATGFKKGEQTTGMTKQCYYGALGSIFTLTLSSVELCPLTVTVPTPAPQTQQQQYYTPQANTPRTVTAFKTGEETTGMTKQCFYNALGSVVTRTINAVALCPLSIQVEMP